MVKIVPIKLKDVGDAWIKWLNDKKVTKYSLQRKKKHNVNSQIDFVRRKLNSKNCKLFKISHDQKFVGVIELKNIDKVNRCAELSYMIGVKKLWNQGIATKSINLIINYSKKELKINKILSSIISLNKASEKVLLKNKFKKYGEIKKFYKFGNKKFSKIFFIRYL